MKNEPVTYLKAISSGYLKTLVTLSVGLWLVPFTLSFLSAEEYGLFFVIGDVILWMGILQFGAGGVVGSRASQLIGQGEVGKIGVLVSTAICLQLLAGFLMLIIASFFALFFENVDEESTENLSHVILLLSLSASIQVNSQVFSSVILANKRIHFNNLIGLICFILRSGLTVMLLLAGLKLMALALATLIASVVLLVLSIFQVRKSLPNLKLSLRNFSLKEARFILSKGLWLTVGSIGGLMIIKLDQIMIGSFLSIALVTSFVLSAKLYLIVTQIQSQLVNALRPHYGQMIGSGRIKEIFNMHRLISPLFLGFSVIVGAIIYLVNEVFISKWVGGNFYLGHDVNFLCAVFYILNISVLPHRILLVAALFQVRSQSIYRIFEGVINVFLTVLLIQVFGVIGAVGASVIANLIFSARVYVKLVAINLFDRKDLLKMEWTKYLLLLPLFVLHAMERTSSSAVMAAVLFIFVLVIFSRTFRLFECYSFVTKNLKRG